MADVVILRCPHCGKVVGKTVDPDTATALLLWCKRCKREVVPDVVESHSDK
jgi:phage FluMu protein Com